MGRVSIFRHVKIIGAANPYDPAFEEYFEQRNFHLWNTSNRNRKVAGIFRNQEGCCPVCKQSLAIESPYEIHHIKPIVMGGKDTINNLVLLHPNCHRLVHAQFGVTFPAGVYGL